MPEEGALKPKINILWFRNGLRLHDNRSLAEAVKDENTNLLPLFIFDGETPVTASCRWNKMMFLLECLEDLDNSFSEVGGRLYMVLGQPTEVFRRLQKTFNINKICFDQDCEPIWLERDNAVKNFCGSHKIEVVETIGQTLWDPLEIIEANGGSPPLTYSQFCHVTRGIGPPKRPIDDVDLDDTDFVELEEFDELLSSLTVFPTTPTPDMVGVEKEGGENKIYKGGEKNALKYFNRRMKWEKDAFLDGSFLPNRRNPDILLPPKSLSPDLKFGALSVKKFYWGIQDAWTDAHDSDPPASASYSIVSQLIWREFFYAMSTNNPFYGEISRNPVCIAVPWYNNEAHLDKFLHGKTGFPFIDAGILQLKSEGWCHHILRNALAMFLTRGNLWLSWEHGLNLFLKYLIDADWAVCAGNWMWVSSSAFEKCLNHSFTLDPTIYGKKVDPHGTYIKKYLPILKNFPPEYIYSPWKAPLDVQKEAGCIIGMDYPQPMVDNLKTQKRNTETMRNFQTVLLTGNREEPPHVKPSNESEVESFFRLKLTDNSTG